MLSTAGAALDLAFRAHVLGVRRDGVVADLRHVRICVRRLVQRLCRVPDGGSGQPNPPVEPRSAAVAAEHGDRDGPGHGGADYRARVGEGPPRGPRGPPPRRTAWATTTIWSMVTSRGFA